MLLLVLTITIMVSTINLPMTLNPYLTYHNILMLNRVTMLVTKLKSHPMLIPIRDVLVSSCAAREPKQKKIIRDGNISICIRIPSV